MKELRDYPGYFITECGEVYDSAGVRRPEYVTGIPPYKYVNLPDSKAVSNGGWQIKRVHILVAQTYIPNPENLPMVNHIDEDKMNCHVTNLEWCTRSQNTLHSVKGRVSRYTKRRVYTEDEKRLHVNEFRLRGGSKRKTYLALGISPVQFDSWLKLF